ncbi:MAG TPA: YqhA family protein [Parvularculaceae bacterium]|nr:YqhA family protein [Parvularculaceae bacterium]
MSGGLEQGVFRATRLFTLVAVLASIAGALLMFYLGAANTVEAFALQIRAPSDGAAGLPVDEATVIELMDALDRFLIGMVLLFFGYGVYGLFIRPELGPRALGLPEWLHVERLGQLKQTLAEVIIVVLFVLFLRVALEAFHEGEGAMTIAALGRFLVLPVAILLLSAALRLARLHPKERAGGRHVWEAGETE